jgi:hypothetical protein
MRAGGLGGGPRFVSWFKRKHFSVSLAGSPTKPLTRAVDCNNMCYMFKPSKIAKFSRIFDDSSLKRV